VFAAYNSKGDKRRPGRLVALSHRLASFFTFPPPFRPLFGHPVPLIPSLFSRSHTTPSPLKSQKTSIEFSTSLAAFPAEILPAVRWPSRQEGQECRKDPHPHPERRQGQGPWCRPQRRRDRYPRWELFPSQPRPTWRRTCKSVRFRTGSVPSPLFFHYLSPPSSSSSHILEALGAILRCFGDRRCCAPGATVACRWFALIGPRAFAPNPQPWTPLLTMSITGYRQREQEYGCLSYLHHVVLGLDEVDRLVHTVTEKLGTRGLTTPSFFPVLPSTSTLPEFGASYKLSSVLVGRSLRRTLSAHGTRRPGLLRPQNLPCACDGVSPEFCVSLGAMPCEASSLGICMSSGVRPNLVSQFLPHVFIHNNVDSRS